VDYPLAHVLAVYDGRAVVSVAPGVPCARCASGRGCGAGLLSAANRPREIEIAVAAGWHLKPGDRVTLAMSSAELLRSALYAYGLPLAGMVSALAVARLLQGPMTDLVAVLVAGGGLVIACLAGRLLLRRNRCMLRLKPEIVAFHSETVT
jgi:sigma-E factor negative regulatory protein RseC